MTGLPDTRAPDRRRTHPWRIFLPLLALTLLGALLTGLALQGEGDDVPPARIYAAQVEDVSVGAGGGPRLEPGTRTVGVHVRVRDLPPSGRLSATVERSGRSSALGRLFGAGGIKAAGGQEERLSVSESGASGIVSFEIRPSSGRALPEGRYGVEIRETSREAGDGRLLARTYFRVGD